MKKIKILKSTVLGGVIYTAGKTYEVKAEVAAALFELKAAEPVAKKKEEAPVAKKKEEAPVAEEQPAK